MDWGMQLEVVGEVFLALLLGGLIGVERELSGKSAGFRTQMLVAGASALLVGLGDAALIRFSLNVNSEVLRADPSRIIQAIITGISFIAAGTIILRDRTDRIEGLTTAATIFFSSAIGIAVALRQFLLAFSVTVMVLVVLHGLNLIQVRLRRRKGAQGGGG
jgi:putative Mg2+ transporter-C (MgtC) family protein